MSTPKMYRRVPGLVAVCILFVTSLLLSGCDQLCALCLQNVQKKEDLQLPAMLLITRSGENSKYDYHRIVKDTSGAESVEVDFDWDKWTIGGVPLKSFIPQDAKEWKLNVYDFDSRTPISDGQKSDFLSINDRTTKLKNIPPDQLLTAELLFRLGAGSDAPMADPVTIVLLFKKGKEIVKPAA